MLIDFFINEFFFVTKFVDNKVSRLSYFRKLMMTYFQQILSILKLVINFFTRKKKKYQTRPKMMKMNFLLRYEKYSINRINENLL